MRYRLRYVFIHINKTGGSSIERALGLWLQHKTAAQLRSELGARRFDARFKFAFVRNPWDRVVSQYAYRVQTDQNDLGTEPISFEEWIVRVFRDRDPRYHDIPRLFMPQCRWLIDENGENAVDFVGRFERLAKDFDAVCRRIGIDATLPHLKRSRRPPYTTVHTPETRRIVGMRFAEDIDRFEYRFGDEATG